MKKFLLLFAAALSAALVVGCATMVGATAGAGIASLSGGDAGKGAVIGGSIGAIVDIVD